MGKSNANGKTKIALLLKTLKNKTLPIIPIGGKIGKGWFIDLFWAKVKRKKGIKNQLITK